MPKTDCGSFTYDDNGNIETMGAPYSITATSHDHRNLALSMTISGTSTNYRYDESGQRFAKKEGMSNGEHYVLDGAATVGVFSDSGTLDYWNIMLGGMVLGRVDANGDRFYYEKDHLGTVRRVLDESGSTTEWYDYDPWGALMRSSTVGTKDGYTGKERDTETGLDYFGARYYMPAFARWTTTDPLADDYPAWSPYNYVMDNPVTLIDPRGEEPCCLPFSPKIGRALLKAGYRTLKSLYDPRNVTSGLEQVAEGTHTIATTNSLEDRLIGLRDIADGAGAVTGTVENYSTAASYLVGPEAAPITLSIAGAHGMFSSSMDVTGLAAEVSLMALGSESSNWSNIAKRGFVVTINIAPIHICYDDLDSIIKSFGYDFLEVLTEEEKKDEEQPGNSN